MAKGVSYAVFVLPVALSLALGGAVMSQAIDGVPAGGQSAGITIIGLEKAYSAPGSVEAAVAVLDAGFDCGDLYIAVRDADGKSVSQAGYFDQCFAGSQAALPMEGKFTATIDEAGRYVLVAEMRSPSGQESIKASKGFTVK